MHPDYKRFLKENPDRVRGNPDDGAMFASLLRRLREMPEPEPRDGFADRVLARMHREESAQASLRRGMAWRWAVRAAAAVAIAWLGVAGIRAWLGGGAGGDPSAAIAMSRAAAAYETIVAEQGADGAWRASVSTDADGGNSLHAGEDGALSAIALLALMHGNPDALSGPHAPTVRRGMDRLVAMQSRPQGLGDGATRAGQSSRYLAAMALREGASLRGAPAAWREAAGRAALDAPSPAEAARLNRQLARSDTMPEAWKRAGGPVLAAALEVLRPRTL